MASSIAATPVFVDQKQSSSKPANSTSITIPAIHHPINEQQQSNNENENSVDCWLALMYVILPFIGLSNKILDNAYIILSNNLEEFSSYYKIEALIILILFGFLCYAAYVPRKLYIMKIVSIIFGILFILDLGMIAIIVNNKCYSTNENGIIEPHPKHCFNLIIYPALSAISMLVTSICTFYIYYSINNE